MAVVNLVYEHSEYPVSKKLASLFVHELRINSKFLLFWIIGVNAYFLLAVSIYPGEEAVQEFLGLFEEEIFQAFLGTLEGDAPAYRIWLSLMIPFIAVATFIFALMYGVRLSVGAISDDTGELIHTQPLNRPNLLLVRFASGVVGITLMMLVSALFLLIPVDSESVPIEYVITYTWWGIYFLISALSVGMFIGVLGADSGRGNMFALLFSVIIYALQASARLLPELEDIVDYIPLNWYEPGAVIMENKVNNDYLVYIGIMLILGTLFSNLLFLKRDLIKEAAIPIPLLSRISRRGGKSSKTGGRSDRDKLLTLWARPLEKKLPFTADFIYSDRKALLITFWALVLFYPAQLMAFNPNDQQFLDTLQGTVEGFGNTGIMKVFTYGHDLSSNLWLWFLITQAVGNHYFFLVPLSAHWIKKIILQDSEQLTGEIIGALPYDRTKVMLQRLLAVLLMLLYIVALMVIWLLLSESVIGIEGNNPTWEVIAILSIIPLYIFIISGGLVLGLLLKDGVRYAQFGLLGLVLWFIAGISVDFNTGIFGLYDPVQIIQQESLSVVNYGVFWLSGLALMFAILIVRLAPKFEWLNIPKADKSVLSSLSEY